MKKIYIERGSGFNALTGFRMVRVFNGTKEIWISYSRASQLRKEGRLIVEIKEPSPPVDSSNISQ